MNVQLLKSKKSLIIAGIAVVVIAGCTVAVVALHKDTKKVDAANTSARNASSDPPKALSKDGTANVPNTDQQTKQSSSTSDSSAAVSDSDGLAGREGVPSGNDTVVNTPTTPKQTGPDSDQTDTKNANIDIDGYAFLPVNLTVKKGTKVTWTNKDDVAHTVTSDTGKGLDSGSLQTGDTYSYTFNDSGSFNYHCKLHTFMVASVTVVD